MHAFQIDPGVGDALHYQDRYDEEIARATGRKPTGPKIDPRADPEALEKLRALG